MADLETTPTTRRTGRARQALGGLLPLLLGVAIGAGAWAVGSGAPGPDAAGEAAPVPPPPIRLELPREWRQVLPPPITFDHMFRRDPDAIWR